MLKPGEKYKILALKEWVPQKLGFVLFLLFAFAFQFSLSAYLASMEDLVMAKQLTREDVNLAFQASLVGMALIFPLLFRIKFRFYSKHILLFSIAMVMLLSFIAATTSNAVVLITASLFLGVFRMIGTFESLSSIQLMITPIRDFGIFFTFVYSLVLLSVQFSGIVSVYTTHWFGVETIYYLMLSIHVLMLLLTAILLRPIHFMKPIPLKGIDWRGMTLWGLLFMALSYLVIYGQTEDWMNSDAIVVSIVLSAVAALLLIYSYRATKMPFIGSGVFKLKSVISSSVIILLMEFFINTGHGVVEPFQAGVMGLDSLALVDLNLWLSLGIIVGAAFCFIWFVRINKSYKVPVFAGFLAFMIYHLLMFRVFSANTAAQNLWLPYFFKGLGYLIIYATIGKYMMKDLSFETFPQGWFIVAIVRNAVGAPVVSSLIGVWQQHRTAHYLDKLATNMSLKAGEVQQFLSQIRHGALLGGNSYDQAQQAASGAIYGKAYLQSLTLAARDIYSAITIFGFLILVGILLYHFSGPFNIRKFGDRFWKA